MSELAAIYAHLETNVVEEAANPSVDDFLANLTAAGFDCETALAEIAKLDNRLAALASSAQIKAYAQERNSLNVDQLIAALITDYPGALQGIADYCAENNSDLPAVAGGRGSNPANLPPSPAIRPLQTRLKQITQELGERGENRQLEQRLNDAAGQQPRPSGLNDTNSDVPYRSGGSGEEYRKEFLEKELLDKAARETEAIIQESLVSHGKEALEKTLRLLNTIDKADPAQIALAQKAIAAAKETMITIGQEAIANTRDKISKNNTNQPPNPERYDPYDPNGAGEEYTIERVERDAEIEFATIAGSPSYERIVRVYQEIVRIRENIRSFLGEGLSEIATKDPDLSQALDERIIPAKLKLEDALERRLSRDALDLLKESVGDGLDGFISNLEEAVKDSKAAKLVRDVEEERAPYKNLN